MATSAASLLKTLSHFLQNNQVSFTNALLILCTVAGEQIFKSTAFRCPSYQPAARNYVISFTLGPAIVLFIVGVMINNVTWRLCHGCQHRTVKSLHTSCEAVTHFFSVLARASVVPCVWFFIVLLDGNYYVCMLSKTPGHPETPENMNLLAESQFISWIFLCAVVGIPAILICCIRCKDTATYMQNKYICMYQDAEQIHFDEKMKSAADVEAQARAGEFMNKPHLDKNDWDVISMAPPVGVKLKNEENYVYKSRLQILLDENGQLAPVATGNQQEVRV